MRLCNTVHIKLTINLFDVQPLFQENEVSYAKKSFHRVEYLTCTMNYEQYEDRPNIIALIIWRSILRKENWRNSAESDARMPEAFSDMDGINEMGINQGTVHFVAECSTSLITESADRRPRDQFPVYSLELLDGAYRSKLNDELFRVVLDARDWKENAFFLGGGCALTSHDRSQTNFFLICCIHEGGRSNCWIDVTSLYGVSRNT